MNTTGSLFAEFLCSLHADFSLPDDVSIINSYSDKTVVGIVKQFCSKFYSDEKKRVLIVGINPGRFGGGITGIPFTDPVALQEHCGISNSFDKRRELSSQFIYEVIEAFGGTKKFYSKFLLSAVCPIGFLKGIKNYNYYDSPELINTTYEFIKYSLFKHSSMNILHDTVVSFGKKNATHLVRLNNELGLFKRMIVLEHPRYIMQYKRKSQSSYINQYVKELSSVCK